MAEIRGNAGSSSGRAQAGNLILTPRPGPVFAGISKDFLQPINVVGQDEHSYLLGMLWRRLGAFGSPMTQDGFNFDGKRKSEARHPTACPIPESLLTYPGDDFRRLPDIVIRLPICGIDMRCGLLHPPREGYLQADFKPDGRRSKEALESDGIPDP